jgi:hypothetical protein
MINPIGKHSHILHLHAAQESSKVDNTAENLPTAPPTMVEKLEARETKKVSDKKKSDLMHVLTSAESLQMLTIINEKPGMKIK